MKEYIVHYTNNSPITEEAWNNMKTLFGEPIKDLVRCKDCKYFIEQYVNPNGRTYNAHLCDAWVKNTDRDGFCHRAERKDNE